MEIPKLRGSVVLPWIQIWCAGHMQLDKEVAATPLEGFHVLVPPLCAILVVPAPVVGRLRIGLPFSLWYDAPGSSHRHSGIRTQKRRNSKSTNRWGITPQNVLFHGCNVSHALSFPCTVRMPRAISDSNFNSIMRLKLLSQSIIKYTTLFALWSVFCSVWESIRSFCECNTIYCTLQLVRMIDPDATFTEKFHSLNNFSLDL